MLLHVEPDHADVSIFVDGIPVFFRSIQINTSFFLDTGTDQIAAYGSQSIHGAWSCIELFPIYRFHGSKAC